MENEVAILAICVVDCIWYVSYVDEYTLKTSDKLSNYKQQITAIVSLTL